MIPLRDVKDKTVLVTGGAGFIGSHLIDALIARGVARVVVIDNMFLGSEDMGRPIITTDQPGCRDVVDNGESGFLVPPRNTQALSAAMARFMSLSPEERNLMGIKSRQKIEREFAESIVLKRYSKWVNRILGAEHFLDIDAVPPGNKKF